MAPDGPRAGPRVRRATLRDVPTLVRHRRMMWLEMGEKDEAALDAADRVYRRWISARIKARKALGLLVEDGGKVVAGGVVWLREEHPRPGFKGGPQPYLMSMYTELDHRGKGHASRIVEEASRWAEAEGFPRFTLHASEMGRPIYAKHGFERTWEMRRTFHRDPATPQC